MKELFKRQRMSLHCEILFITGASNKDDLHLRCQACVDRVLRPYVVTFFGRTTRRLTYECVPHCRDNRFGSQLSMNCSSSKYLFSISNVLYSILYTVHYSILYTGSCAFGIIVIFIIRSSSIPNKNYFMLCFIDNCVLVVIIVVR